MKALNRIGPNFMVWLAFLVILGTFAYCVIRIVRLTTDLCPVTFRATLRASGAVDYVTGGESLNYTYLIRDMQFKNADVTIQDSDFDVYAVITNNGLGYGHNFDDSLDEMGVQIGSGGVEETATVAIPGEVIRPLNPLLHPVLLGGHDLNLWSMGDDTDASLTFDTTPAQLNPITWRTPPASTYRVQISPYPDQTEFERLDVRAPSGSSLEIETQNELPWLLVITGDMEAYNGKSRLEIPYTDEVFRNEAVLVVVGRDTGRMMLKAHEASPSGWITYGYPSDASSPNSVNPAAYYPEVLAFEDVRQIHLDTAHGLIENDSPDGTQDLAQDTQITIEDMIPVPPTLEEEDEMWLPPDPTAWRPQEYRRYGWSLRLPLSPESLDQANGSVDPANALYVQGKSDHVIIGDRNLAKTGWAQDSTEKVLDPIALLLLGSLIVGFLLRLIGRVHDRGNEPQIG